MVGQVTSVMIPTTRGDPAGHGVPASPHYLTAYLWRLNHSPVSYIHVLLLFIISKQVELYSESTYVYSLHSLYTYPCIPFACLIPLYLVYCSRFSYFIPPPHVPSSFFFLFSCYTTFLPLLFYLAFFTPMNQHSSPDPSSRSPNTPANPCH